MTSTFLSSTLLVLMLCAGMSVTRGPSEWSAWTKTSRKSCEESQGARQLSFGGTFLHDPGHEATMADQPTLLLPSHLSELSKAHDTSVTGVC